MAALAAAAGLFPGGAASKMAGKGAGEVDGGAVLLTGYSIWGEEGPRVELDVRGGCPAEVQWQTVVAGSDSAG